MSENISKLRENLITEIEVYLEVILQYFRNHSQRRVFIAGACPIHEPLKNIQIAANKMEVEPLGRTSELLLGLLESVEKEEELTVSELAYQAMPLVESMYEMLDCIKENDINKCSSIFDKLKKNFISENEVVETEKASEADISEELVTIFSQEARDNLKVALKTLEQVTGNMAESVHAQLYHCLINLKNSAEMLSQKSLLEVIGLLLALLDYTNQSEGPIDTKTVAVFHAGLNVIKKTIFDFDSKKGEKESVKETIKLFQDDIKPLLPADFDANKFDSKIPMPNIFDDGIPALNLDGFDEESIKNEMKQVFLNEGEEHLSTLGNLIIQSENNLKSEGLVHQIFRVVHTLKGAAATAGFEELGNTAHSFENVLEDWRDNNQVIGESERNLLYEGHRSLNLLLHSTKEEHSLVDNTKKQFLQSLKNFEQATANDEKASQDDVADEQNHKKAEEKQADMSDEFIDSLAPSRMVKVDMNRLDSLMNIVSELGTYSSRSEDITVTFGNISRKLKWERKNLARIINEFQHKYQWDRSSHDTGVEGFSEMEMDRYNDLALFARTMAEFDLRLGNLLGDTESIMEHFQEDSASLSFMVGSLRDEMIQARMVPLSILFARLEYQTMNLARTLGKKVKIETSGGDTELDKNITDALAESLIHIIRNCLDHGIELTDQRVKENKAKSGKIRISGYAEQRNVIIKIEDDGAGIDVDKIRQVAVSIGLFKEEEMESKSRDEILSLIFYPRITTRTKAGEVSGRGVGMDAVKHSIAEMYGSIQVKSEPQKGTSFTIKLPFTLAMQSIITVTVDQHKLNVPMNYVEQILEPEILQVNEKTRQIKYEGRKIPLRWLSSFFRIEQNKEGNNFPVLVLRNGDKRMGLVVNSVVGREEAIIRPMSQILESCKHFLGSTITAHGEVRLVINVPVLFELVNYLPILMPHKADSQDTVKILIADDSLSVRQNVQMLLEKHGIKVETAKDGVDAWRKLSSVKPDLAIIDIEMPYMDGFEVIKKAREDAELNAIAMVVLTSRGGSKHQKKASEVGADGFMTKPVSETQLIVNVREALVPSLRDLLDENDPLLAPADVIQKESK